MLMPGLAAGGFAAADDETGEAEPGAFGAPILSAPLRLKFDAAKGLPRGSPR
jgi:hypothetical protein